MSGKKLEGIALKKSDILADIEIVTEPAITEEKGSAASSFQEDMLKALSAKKSANETELPQEMEDEGPGSPGE